jgi:hypothetical protein
MSDQQTAAETGQNDPLSPTLPCDAGTDTDIMRRLKRNPTDADAQLDRGLDESMDASDPPSAMQPGDHGDPVPSTGYDEEAERKLAQSR